MSLKYPVKLFVHDYDGLVKELMDILPEQQSKLIIPISDHKEILEGHGEADDQLVPFLSLDEPVFFLLYLNKYTFEESDDDTELNNIIKSCMNNPKINIIVIYERDVSKGGCEFNYIYEKTPEQLIKPRHNHAISLQGGFNNDLHMSSSGLYDDIVIPLYANEKYRLVGLKQILCQMGAKEVKNSWKKK